MNSLLSLRENRIETTASKGLTAALQECVVSETCMNRCLAKWTIPCSGSTIPILGSVYPSRCLANNFWLVFTETCVSELLPGNGLFQLSGLMSQYILCLILSVALSVIESDKPLLWISKNAVRFFTVTSEKTNGCEVGTNVVSELCITFTALKGLRKLFAAVLFPSEISYVKQHTFKILIYTTS